MNTDRDIRAIATRRDDDDGYRATGPRREPPAVCPICGEDVPDRPFFGDRTCGEARCRDAAVRR